MPVLKLNVKFEALAISMSWSVIREAGDSPLES